MSIKKIYQENNMILMIKGTAMPALRQLQT